MQCALCVAHCLVILALFALPSNSQPIVSIPTSLAPSLPRDVELDAGLLRQVKFVCEQFASLVQSTNLCGLVQSGATSSWSYFFSPPCQSATVPMRSFSPRWLKCDTTGRNIVSMYAPCFLDQFHSRLHSVELSANYTNFYEYIHEINRAKARCNPFPYTASNASSSLPDDIVCINFEFKTKQLRDLSCCTFGMPKIFDYSGLHKVFQLTNLTTLDIHPAFLDEKSNLYVVDLPYIPAISQLTKLTYLSLGIGRDADIPTAISSWTQLKTLKLIGRVIETPDFSNWVPAARTLPDLSRLTELTQLQLDYIRARDFQDLSMLSKLRILKMSGANITGPLPANLLPSKLEQLTLTDNLISSFDFSKFPKLKYLSLESNNIRSSLANTFPTLGLLTYLNLAQNYISGTIPLYFNRLKYLNLRYNSLSGTLPQNFWQNSSLNTLILRHNDLSGSLPPFVNIVNLLLLDLSYNQFSGLIPAMNATNLRVLNFASNNLFGLLPPISVPDTFHTLDLSNNAELEGIIFQSYTSLDRWINRPGIQPTPALQTLKLAGTNLGGGCYSLTYSPNLKTCEFGNVGFKCSCELPDICTSAKCYQGNPCTSIYQPCAEGAICVKPTPFTSVWATCKCEADYAPLNGTFRCLAKDPCRKYGCGSPTTSCTNGKNLGERICTCPDTATSAMSGKPMVGNVTFTPCVFSDLCIFPGCNSKTHTTCMWDSAAKSRTCSCNTGYQVIGENSTATKSVLTDPNAPFAGCFEINFCDVQLAGCGNFSICTNVRPNVRSCRCVPGYSTTSNKTEFVGYEPFPGCTEINPCLTRNGGCEDKCNFVGPGIRTCSCGYNNSSLSFDQESCLCFPGFQRNGTNCLEINECEVYNCSDVKSNQEVSCKDGRESRYCECPIGFVGSSVLINNQAFGGCSDFPECVYRCDSNSECEEGPNPNERTCTCDKGFTGTMILAGDAPFPGCTDIDECASASACPEGNQCTNTPSGTFTCSCLPGYLRLNENDEVCSKAGISVGVIAGIVIAVVLALIALGIGLYYHYSKSKIALDKLPEDIAMHYKHYYDSSSGWKQNGSGSSKFYSKLIKPDSEWWKVFSNLLVFLEAKDLPVDEVHAIFNPTLVNNFINNRELIKSRLVNSPQVFNSKQWQKSKARAEARKWVYNVYEIRAEQAYEWNSSEIVPILPTAHGTNFDVANSICGTGFVALSSLDAGYYGKGIYFTTYALYTTPYFAQQKKPALLISFVVMGNAFPVTEHHHQDGSLLGQPLQSGYNSHFVLVNRQGEVPNFPTSPTERYFDEIVINQESQICPAYLVKLTAKHASKLLTTWNRNKPESGPRTGLTQQRDDLYIPLMDMQ